MCVMVIIPTLRYKLGSESTMKFNLHIRVPINEREGRLHRQ